LALCHTIAMSGIIWGDVATWFTGVLTGGSLLLGFSILRNDRRKEERAKVSDIVCWYREISADKYAKVYPGEEPSSEDRFFYRVALHNLSPRPVLYAQIDIHERRFSEIRSQFSDEDLRHMDYPGFIAASVKPFGMSASLEGRPKKKDGHYGHYRVVATEIYTSQMCKTYIPLPWPAEFYTVNVVFFDSSNLQWCADLTHKRLQRYNWPSEHGGLYRFIHESRRKLAWRLESRHVRRISRIGLPSTALAPIPTAEDDSA
jgi:hypothetical protein